MLYRVAVITSLLLFAHFGSVVFAQQPNTPRLELGPQLTQIYLPVQPVGNVQYQLGYGMVFSERLFSRLGADASFSVTPTIPISGTSFAGGRLTEAFFGARVGLFFARHFELYGKVRPGFARFGDVILHTTSSPTLQFQTGSLTDSAVDVGGIAMLRVSRRVGIRYEAGDTIIYYGSRIVDPSQRAVPSHLVNTLQLGVAFVVGF